MLDARRRILQGATAPAEAQRRLERVLAVLHEAAIPVEQLDDQQVQLLRNACLRVPYLAALLARDPHRLGRVSADPYLEREKNRTVMADELAAAVADSATDDPDVFAAILRRYRGDEMVRLGSRELTPGMRGEVGRELAALADVAFDAAIAFHSRALERRFGPPVCVEHGHSEARLAVIGMGKLGGEELNFSSDVDVIYVYTSDEGSAGEETLHRYFSELCRRVTAALAEVTADDFVYRVDLRLRPEGTRGAIANSLSSLERYYESWGRPWERQAWLKARPCAGDLALGERALEILEPFIHPRTTSPKVIDEVMELNRKIKLELDSSGIDSGFDVKNGRGGIREIEFFVQALQLVHAGRRAALRSRSTLAALDQLMFAGIITSAEQGALSAAYRFLRHVEHMLQLETGRQTQRLPARPEALDLLAQRLEYTDRHQFIGDLEHHTDAVAELFATLGEEPDPLPPAVRTLLDLTASDQALEEAFAELGFSEPSRAVKTLGFARAKPASPLGPTASGAAARVAPDLLREIAKAPDPDQALRFVVDLVGKRGSWSEIWPLCAANPMVLRLVASLLGTSAYLSRTFVDHPELIDELLAAGHADGRRTAEALRADIDARLTALDEDDQEGHWNQLAELKNNHVLRIGLADIAGTLEAQAVTGELTVLAETCLQASFDIVERSMRRQFGTPIAADSGREAELAVVALGKLGGRELGYASDLDIVFVFSGAGETDGRRSIDNRTYMTRLAQRLVHGLHALHPGGRLYEADTRLLPEGSKGLLVSSFDGWRQYHATSAHIWERQALVKLRPIAGSQSLGETVVGMVADHLYGGPPGSDGRPTVPQLCEHMRSMRDRIERELAGSALDLKAGRGGLNDIEFAAQFLRLVHGHKHPGLRVTGTEAALEAARDLGVADGDRCERLLEGYRFLRRLELRIRIVHDRSEHQLPPPGDELEHLARRMQFDSGDILVDYFRRVCASVREAYDSIVTIGAAGATSATDNG